MPSLIISYFASVDKGAAGIPLGSETVETSDTSAASAAIPSGASVASVWSDAAHYVAFGDGTPVAAEANGFYLPAGERVLLRTFVASGQTKKIAAIAVTAPEA